MKIRGFALVACLAVTACNSPPPAPRAGDVSSPPALSTIDPSTWRDVGNDNDRIGALATMCAGALEGLQAAEPSLRDKVALQVPWQVQTSRRGKLQAQCVWTGPAGVQGRIVVDVLCADGDKDRCFRFAYATLGTRRIEPVIVHHAPPPPVSAAYPPGRDDLERGRSTEIINWTRDKAPDQLGALRVEFRAAKVGIDADAKIPVLCGEVRERGHDWTRFAVFSIGAAANPPSPSFNWRREPGDREAVREFCDVRREGFQWYEVPDRAMN